MGEPKKDESLDRINNNLGYSKKNCRWANQKTQQRNRRGNLEVTIFGKTKPLSEWAELGVVSYPTVWFRINSGWEPIHAIFIPNLKAKKLSITNRMKSMATERAKTKILEGG